MKSKTFLVLVQNGVSSELIKKIEKTEQETLFYRHLKLCLQATQSITDIDVSYHKKLNRILIRLYKKLRKLFCKIRDVVPIEFEISQIVLHEPTRDFIFY